VERKSSKRRKKTKTVWRSEWHGQVKVEEQVCQRTKKSRFRTICRRQFCPKELRYKNHPKWDLAVNYAKRLDSELTGARERRSDPKLLAQLELAEEKIRSAGLVDSIGFSLMDNAHKELQIPDIVEAGIAFTKALNEVNELRVDAGERKYSVTWALSDWVYSCKKTTKAENRILFSQEINRFINEKSGSSGGKGNQPLGKGALNEWKLHVSKYLLNWIGNEKLGADPDVLFNLVKRKINSGVNESGVDKGKAWSMGYRHKCGSKISQFGRWLTRNRKLGINPFENLPIEFPKEEKGLVEGFETAQVTKLFKAAAEINNGDMIPYFALLFYSTCRPEDIADPKVKEERLQWKNFKGWAYEHYAGVKLKTE
jgi:hypothetical protein